jgi:hypothetical protein
MSTGCLDVQEYLAWLKKKSPVEDGSGFSLIVETPEWFHPHAKDAVEWAVSKGRAALFEAFGLAKTVQQMQIGRNCHIKTGGKVLFVAPIGVRHEFTHHDDINPTIPMGMDVVYCKTDVEVEAANTPYIITNYERVRKGDITPANFDTVLLDEASVLRSYGTQTTQQFTEKCADVPYRFIATATPAPNARNGADYKELINYANFLGVMDRGQFMTRWLQRDSKKAGKLSVYAHQEEEFWLWCASWALFLTKPSDLGYSDDGFKLPGYKVVWHKVETDLTRAWSESDKRGQFKLLPDMSADIQTSSKERRNTLDERIHRAVDVIQSQPDENWIIWHYLEDERKLLEKLLPDMRSVYGSMNKMEEREDIILGFGRGEFQYLGAKPQMLGSGCNFQRHCARAIFVAPTDKFNDFIQAVHRILRFQQSRFVEIHIVFADTQDPVRQVMLEKWATHDRLQDRMSTLIKKYGLSHEALNMRLTRELNDGQQRTVVESEFFKMIQGDCVLECARMEDESVDFIGTSDPFSDHYEYTIMLNDFGHNMGDAEFFKQKAFQIPDQWRILKPGRVVAVHVKDRITYGNMTGEGMYGVNEFSDKTVKAYRGRAGQIQDEIAALETVIAGTTGESLVKALRDRQDELKAEYQIAVKESFIYMGRITIDTDVVRENNQTYRLGHTENSKDSTKMGVGSSEYVLLFRKWSPDMSPNETANGPYPVTKNIKDADGDDFYSVGRWQIHASATWKTNGDELLSPAQFANLPMESKSALWERYCKSQGYDYDYHVDLCDACDEDGSLPREWMLFKPISNNPDIWTDIQRIDTLNTEQHRKAAQKHVCPLQKSVIRRLIERYTNPGDVVLDPFAGIGSVPYVAIQMGRKAIGVELNPVYFNYAVGYCEKAEEQLNAPTLFDLINYKVA